MFVFPIESRSIESEFCNYLHSFLECSQPIFTYFHSTFGWFVCRENCPISNLNWWICGRFFFLSQVLEIVTEFQSKFRDNSHKSENWECDIQWQIFMNKFWTTEMCRTANSLIPTLTYLGNENRQTNAGFNMDALLCRSGHCPKVGESSAFGDRRVWPSPLYLV